MSKTSEAWREYDTAPSVWHGQYDQTYRDRVNALEDFWNSASSRFRRRGAGVRVSVSMALKRTSLPRIASEPVVAHFGRLWMVTTLRAAIAPEINPWFETF